MKNRIPIISQAHAGGGGCLCRQRAPAAVPPGSFRSVHLLLVVHRQGLEP